MRHYPKKIWQAILVIDDEIKKLVDQGFEWVSNFPFSQDRDLLFPEDYDIWVAKRNIEKAGYEVIFANAYTRNGKFMSYSKSLWRRAKKLQRVRLMWKGRRYTLQLWYPDRIELKDSETGKILTIHTTWRRRKDGKPADDHAILCRRLDKRGFNSSDCE
jgi:hypothetical protein